MSTSIGNNLPLTPVVPSPPPPALVTTPPELTPPAAPEALPVVPTPEAPAVINAVSPALEAAAAPDVPPEVAADVETVAAAAESVTVSAQEVATALEGEPEPAAANEPRFSFEVFARDLRDVAPGSGASIEFALGVKAGTPAVGEEVMEVGLAVRATAGLSVAVGTGVGPPYVATLDLGVEIEATARIFGNEMSAEFERTMSNGVGFQNKAQVQEFARLSQEVVANLGDGDARSAAMRNLLDYADEHRFSAQTNTLTISGETATGQEIELQQTDARIRTEGYRDDNENGIREADEPDLSERISERSYSGSFTGTVMGQQVAVEVARLETNLDQRVVDPWGMFNEETERNSEQSAVSRVRLTVTPAMFSRDAEGDLVALLEQGLSATPGAAAGGLSGAEIRSMLPALREAVSEGKMSGSIIIEYSRLDQNIPGQDPVVHSLRAGSTLHYEGELQLPTTVPGVSITGGVELNGTYLYEVARIPARDSE
jgi:hypothetical protein